MLFLFIFLLNGLNSNFKRTNKGLNAKFMRINNALNSNSTELIRL